ncbi:MAG: hypothetical protein ACI4EV_05065 [Lachnospiraceae bacterium]
MKNKKNKIIISVIFVVTGFIGIVFAGIDFNNKYNIREFVITTVTGLDGRGKVTCEIDSEKLLEKISEGEKNAVIILKYKNLIDTIKITIDGNNGELKNGDRVNATVSYDEELLKENKIEFENNTFEIKIENLSEGKKIDIFEKIDVVVAGISPLAYANVQNNWDDEFMSKLKFSLDKTNRIARGDTITVMCTTSEEEFLENGYIPEAMTKEYVVKAANSYIDSSQDIDETVMNEIWQEIKLAIHRETVDMSFRILYKATGNEKYLYQYNREEVVLVEPGGVYYLKKKDDTAEGADNYIIFLARAQITNQTETVDVYFGFEYSEASKDNEGKFNLSHISGEEKYICSSLLDKVYNQMIDSRKNAYSVESLDIDFVK